MIYYSCHPLNSQLVNYADDNHICHESQNLEMLQKHLQDDSNKAVKWFDDNQTTTNPDKFQSIVLSRRNVETIDISVDDHTISRDNTLKMLGVTFDDKLNFKAHIRNICQTASCQINALKRISKFLNEQFRMNVYKSFINANFNYCPMVRMFCGNTNLNKLKKLQERALAVVYGDNSLDYDDMLQRSVQLRIWINIIRLVAIEMFKCTMGINPAYMNTTYETRADYCNLSLTPNDMATDRFNTLVHLEFPPNQY